MSKSNAWRRYLANVIDDTFMQAQAFTLEDLQTAFMSGFDEGVKCERQPRSPDCDPNKKHLWHTERAKMGEVPPVKLVIGNGHDMYTGENPYCSTCAHHMHDHEIHDGESTCKKCEGY